jgi:hypothetical protein
VRLVKAWLIAALVALVTASAAQAAYAPKLAIKISPATPGAAAAITSTITQASGETANKTVIVKFPAGFTANIKVKVTPCTPDQEQSDSCPDASQIGTATASTSLGTLNGPVYFEVDKGQFKLVVYVRGFAGLISDKLIGVVSFAGNRIQTTFDDLPNTPTTSFELALEGGDKALTNVTTTCGPAVFDGDFTSQNGEHATAQATVDVEGCPTTPVISALAVKPRAFRAVRRFSDTQRPGFGTTIKYTLSEATHGARFTVQRRVGRRWRKAGSFIGPGAKGPNRVKWDGRVHDRPLAPGVYRFSLVTTSNAGVRSKRAVARFTIRR